MPREKEYAMPMGRFTVAALTALLVLAAGFAAAQQPIIYVNQRNAASFTDGISWATAVTTIQQGLRRAELQGGAEVWVAEGDYREVIFMQAGTNLYGGFLGNERNRDERDSARNLTVINGAEANGGETAEVVLFGASNATIDGFLIRGGNGPAGAGMVNDNASPTIRNCVFADNIAQLSGGAILNNPGAYPLIEHCEFRGNAAGLSGGAIANNGAQPEIRHCLFLGNATDGAGGAIANTPGAAALISDSVFRLNTAVTGGGAIHNQEAPATIERCIFEDNFVSLFGGAIFNDQSEPLIINSLFFNNVATERGGAIANLEAETILINCTFARNEAGAFGGAIFNNAADARAVNCILWDNDPEEVANVESTFSVRFSNVGGSAAGEGNISSDPLFRDPDNGDFSLMPRSRAINTGTTSGAPVDDIEGTPRPQGEGIDMGAYEATEIEDPGALPIGGCIVINWEGKASQAGNGVLLGLMVLALVATRRRK
jgi:hypothetical protein